MESAVVDGNGVPAVPTTTSSLDNNPLPFNSPLLFVIPSEARDLLCAIRVPHIYRSKTTLPLSSRPERSGAEGPAVSFSPDADSKTRCDLDRAVQTAQPDFVR